MWYDPITERWYKMPAQKVDDQIIEPEENIYTKAERINRQNDIWEALKDVCCN